MVWKDEKLLSSLHGYQLFADDMGGVCYAFGPDNQQVFSLDEIGTVELGSETFLDFVREQQQALDDVLHNA